MEIRKTERGEWVMTVDEEDLDNDEDLAVFQGHPFTGTAVRYHPNGILRKEAIFRDGFEHGLCREWHESGQLSCEWFAVAGVVHGKRYDWYENGLLKAETIFRRGVELSYEEWDKLGRLVQQREIDWNSELGKYAAKLI
jgi:antitoxin component YwqK of YwqJK toxin-antitoxin module